MVAKYIIVKSSFDKKSSILLYKLGGERISTLGLSINVVYLGELCFTPKGVSKHPIGVSSNTRHVEV